MAKKGNRQILYIGEFRSERLESVTIFSDAGMNKKDGLIDVFQNLNYDVTGFSPIFVPESGKSIYQSFNKNYKGINIKYPITLCLHPLVNMIFTILVSLIGIYKLRTKDFDTIVFYNFEPQYCIPAIFAKHLFGASLVVQYEDGLSNHHSLRIALPARLMRVTTTLDGALLVSSQLKEKVSTSNTAVVRGVSSVYDCDYKSINKNEMIDTEAKVTVLFSGGLREGKGIDLYLDAIKDCIEHLPEVIFLVCGHGPEERKQEIQNRIKKFDSERIKFLGRVEPWEAYLNLIHSVDILVALEDPNDAYNQLCFPSKLIEYANTGNIVVTSDISDVSNLKPQPFIIVDEYDSDTLAKSIEEVCDKIEVKKCEAEKHNDEWISERCSVESVSKRVDDAIQDSLN